jgi:hypothetical protein
MDLSISAVSAVDKAVAALADAVRAVEDDALVEQQGAVEPQVPVDTTHSATQEPLTLLARGGLVERILGEVHTDAAAAPARPAGEHVDNSLEHGVVQTQARPQMVAAEPVRTDETALPAAAYSRSDFAVPAALLIPATLIGLQVERAEAWPLPQPAFVPLPAQRVEAPVAEARHSTAEEDTPPSASQDEEGKTEDEPPAETEQEDLDAVEAEREDAWCEALTVALREALAAKIPPQPLLAAADQWQRGRCVVLAFPQGLDPAGPAWAFVLWPRKFSLSRRRSDGSVVPLALFGLRVEARLQWSSPPREIHWCHVRVVKEHHPRRGRQLVPPGGAEAGAPVPCEVQLGPVLARSLRWCDVRVRIDAAQRFWTALGAQWSVHVVVCSQPLTKPRAPAAEEV